MKQTAPMDVTSLTKVSFALLVLGVSACAASAFPAPPGIHVEIIRRDPCLSCLFISAVTAESSRGGRQGRVLQDQTQNPPRMRVQTVRPPQPPHHVVRPAGLPRVFLLNAGELAAVRPQTLAGAAEFAPALAELRQAADRALRAGPFSVMNKTGTPPSGDRHDYMSLSIYSWPNPATTDGLPYVTRDGHVNPESAGPAYDATSLNRMLDAVDTLSLAYYLTGAQNYADRASELVRVWFLDGATRMNPNMRYSEIVPGRPQSGGTVIESRGFMRVVDAAGLLEGARSWTTADDDALSAWFQQLLRWIQESPQGQVEATLVNNHGSWYDAQVADFALFTEQGAIAARVADASRMARIARQIEPDGRQPYELARTKSFQYSVFNLEALFDLASVGARVGVDLWVYQTADGRSIRKALDFLLQFADGSKAWPYPELEPINFFNGLAPLMSHAAVVYPDGQYLQRLAQLFPQQTALQRLELRLGALRVLG